MMMMMMTDNSCYNNLLSFYKLKTENKLIDLRGTLPAWYPKNMINAQNNHMLYTDSDRGTYAYHRVTDYKLSASIIHQAAVTVRRAELSTAKP